VNIIHVHIFSAYAKGLDSLLTKKIEQLMALRGWYNMTNLFPVHLKVTASQMTQHINKLASPLNVILCVIKE